MLAFETEAEEEPDCRMVAGVGIHDQSSSCFLTINHTALTENWLDRGVVVFRWCFLSNGNSALINPRLAKLISKRRRLN
jgi:hypothetical protein